MWVHMSRTRASLLWSFILDLARRPARCPSSDDRLTVLREREVRGDYHLRRSVRMIDALQ
jgi:hypothetical protein